MSGPLPVSGNPFQAIPWAPPGSDAEGCLRIRSGSLVVAEHPDLHPQRSNRSCAGRWGDLTAQWELFDLMEQTWPRLAKNLAELRGRWLNATGLFKPGRPDGEQPDEEATRRKKVVEEVLGISSRTRLSTKTTLRISCGDLGDAWEKGSASRKSTGNFAHTKAGTITAIKAARWIHLRLYGYPAQTVGAVRIASCFGRGDRPRRRPVFPGSGCGPSLGPQPGNLPSGQVFDRDRQTENGSPDRRRSSSPTGLVVGGRGYFTGEWLVNLAQIFGVPIRWANYAQGTPPEQIRKIEDMLANMGSASWAAFPDGTHLELKEAMKSGADNPQLALLGLIDRICDLLILGKPLTSDVSGSGSRALGEVHATF